MLNATFHSKYNVLVQDLDVFFLKTNKSLMDYLGYLGLELDLKSKDQKKIYFHFLLKEIFEFLKEHNQKIIFYSNKWFTTDCNFYCRYMSKLEKNFGIKIYSDWFTLDEFNNQLDDGLLATCGNFELFLNKDSKPKSFKRAKQFLVKEGFTDLVENYFQDITNKMMVFC